MSYGGEYLFVFLKTICYNNCKGVITLERKFNKCCFSEETNNYDKQYLSSAFLRGIAFGKNVSDFEGESATISIKNKDDIRLAVKKAYIDMSPRTFDKNGEWWNNPENAKPNSKERLKEKETDWQQAKEELFKWLADEFHAYFENGSYKVFDDWHKEICDKFLNEFKPKLKNYGYDAEKSLKYGKAQKIVNMTFKYLFCFDDAKDYAEKFDVCHMPIDSYILKWYNDCCNDCYNGMSKEKRCTVAWSDLDKGTYDELQKNIKKILDGYNPFLAEFYIWAEYIHRSSKNERNEKNE